MAVNAAAAAAAAKAINFHAFPNGYEPFFDPALRSLCPHLWPDDRGERRSNKLIKGAREHWTTTTNCVAILSITAADRCTVDLPVVHLADVEM